MARQAFWENEGLVSPFEAIILNECRDWVSAGQIVDRFPQQYFTVATVTWYLKKMERLCYLSVRGTQTVARNEYLLTPLGEAEIRKTYSYIEAKLCSQ